MTMPTREQIMSLPPSEVLDALVAKYVMGQDVPARYSTYIAQAWQVVEQLGHLYPGINCVKLAMTIKGWCCRVRVNQTAQGVFVAEAKTAPLAICRAALLSVCQEGRTNPGTPHMEEEI